jgi:hypothetical protein
MIKSAVLMCSCVLPFVLLAGMGAQEEPPSAHVRVTCDQIYSAVLPIPGTDVDRRDGTFYDDYLERDLTGCMIVVSGSWGELGARSNPGDSIYKLLSDRGWKQEPQYSADGPDGTFFALSKGDVWCFVRGEWDGGDDADSTYVASDVYQFVICCARFEESDPGAEEDE